MSDFLLPTIRIGNFDFSLIRKWFDGRQLVNIHSRNIHTNKLDQFWVYASLSELGIWRLCVYSNKDLLYKGPDYSQSTVIHIDLQRFINNHLERIPEVQLTEQQIIDECVCSGENNYRKKTTCIQGIIDAIDSKERMLNIHDFKKFTDCGNYLSNLNIEHISNTVKSIYDCGKLTKLHPYNYVFIHHQQTGISNINVTGDIYRVSLISKERGSKEMTEEDKKSLVNFEKTKKINEDRANKYDMWNLYETSMKFYEDKIQNIKDKYTPIPDIDLYFFAGNLGNLSIESEDAGVGLPSDIYQNLNTVCGKPLHIFPILLTTNDSTITEFGIYTKYVPAGAFICKLFDYEEQCVDEDRNVEEGAIKCTPGYFYIGDRYLQMFPYNTLIEQIKAQTDCYISTPIIHSTKRKSKKKALKVSPSIKKISTRKSTRNKKVSSRGGRKFSRSRA